MAAQTCEEDRCTQRIAEIHSNLKEIAQFARDFEDAVQQCNENTASLCCKDYK